MHSAKKMMKTCMQFARVNQMIHSQLHDESEPLHIWMFNQIENKLIRN